MEIVTPFVVVAFYFVFSSTFFCGSNLAFGQSYSGAKNAWKSTRPQIEPGATSSSDVASKRANILLNSAGNRAESSRTKTRSRSDASPLKTYRPNAASSSVISPSSFREKKVDYYGSSENVRHSFDKNDARQDESTDQENTFSELKRREHIDLLDAQGDGLPGMASFELAEPQSDLLEEESSETIPYPSVDPQSSLSVSLDEEVEGVQDARQNCYFSGLELEGSEFDSGDDELESIVPQSKDVDQEIATIKEQIAETLDQIRDESNESATDEEEPDVAENDEEETESVESFETPIDVPIVDLDDIALDSPEEESREEEENSGETLDEESSVGMEFEFNGVDDAEIEEPVQEVEEIERSGEVEETSEDVISAETETGEVVETEAREPVQADEEIALPDEIVASLEDKYQEETELEDVEDEEERTPAQTSENAVPSEELVSDAFVSDVDLEEENDEENDETPGSELDSEESDVPQTGALLTTGDEPTRHSIPADSILALDDEEFDEEPKVAPVKKIDRTPMTLKNPRRTANVSFPKTFAEEEEEDVNDEEIVETLKSLEKGNNKERSKIKTTIPNETGVEVETSSSLQTDAESDVNFSESNSEGEISESDDRLFSKWRVLQRKRQRRLFNARLLEAPTPPSADDVDPEVANQTTEPPLLTKENANLPSLDVNGRKIEAHKPALDEIDAKKFNEEAKKFAWTKGAFTITPYGFLNLSVAADTQRSTPGEFILYVQSPEVDESPGFSVDARTSRLGLDIAGPRVEALSADLGGKVEFDFQGSVNGSKNKGGLQLRRAYVELVDKQHDRKFLAGQDWEIISPVAPQMLNYLPLGFVGDMQYRRGQVRFDQGWTCSSDLRVLGQVAVCDNVIGDYTSTSGVSGATSGWPVLEARLAGAFFGEARDGLPVTLGVSGHIGEQNYKFSALAGVPSASTAVKRPIKTWSANFDLDAPITKTQKLQGEVFTGSNLSTFCGGINQGIDLIRREGIRSSGGWLAWHSDCTEKMDVNFGYGIDKPDEKDLVGTSSPSNGYTTARTRNQVYFVNCIYNWTPNFMTGLETSYWQTDYRKADVSLDEPVFYDMESGKSTRIEFVTRLSF